MLDELSRRAFCARETLGFWREELQGENGPSDA